MSRFYITSLSVLISTLLCLVACSRSTSHEGKGISLSDSARLQSLTEEIRVIGKSNLDSSLVLIDSLFRLSRVQNNAFYHAEALKRKGYYYLAKQQFDSSLVYFQKSQAYREKMGDSILYANSFIHLSSIHFALKQFALAKQDIVNAERIYRRENNIRGLYSSYNQLGIFYGRQDIEDSSKTAFLKAHRYAQQSGDSMLIASTMDNLGIAYHYNHEYDSAEHYFLKVIDIYLKDSNYVHLAGTKESLANLYISMGQTNKGLKLLKDAYEEAVSLGHRKYMSTALVSLYQAFEELGEIDSAYKYVKRLSIHKSETYREALAEEIAHAKVKFETEKIELQKNHAEKQVAKDKKIKLTLYIVLAILLFVGFLILRNVQQKRRLAEKEVELHKERVDKVLRDHEMKTFEAMVEVQESERKRIAEDLHDRLGSILSAVKLHFAAVEEKMKELKAETDAQYSKAYELLDLATQEVRSISHDMLSNVLVKFGLLPALHDLQDTLESSGQIKMEIFDHGMEHRLDNNVEIAIYRIIQELISNILKHANASRIEIELTMGHDNLNIIVSDDGKGFDINKNLSAGVGLQNIEKRLYSIDGKMHIDSQINKGTSIVIDIKLNHD